MVLSRQPKWPRIVLANPIWRVEYLVVEKPHNENAITLNKDLAFTIIHNRAFVQMGLAIKLDRQVFRWTVEIKNVAANTVLSAKFSSIEL